MLLSLSHLIQNINTTLRLSLMLSFIGDNPDVDAINAISLLFDAKRSNNQNSILKFSLEQGILSNLRSLKTPEANILYSKIS